MSLTILTLITIITSPWFFLITFGKIIPAKFYLPNIGDFLNNFFSYFSFDYLFFVGDPIFKNSIPEIGVFHLWQLPFFLIGAYFVFSEIKKNWLVITLLFLFSAFASFFRPSPNIFVSIPLLFILSVIITVGIDSMYKKFLKKKSPIRFILLLSLLIFIFYNLFFFWHQYKVHYPKKIEKNLVFQSSQK